MNATRDKANSMGITYMRERTDAWIIKALTMNNKTFTQYLNLVKNGGSK